MEEKGRLLHYYLHFCVLWRKKKYSNQLRNISTIIQQTADDIQENIETGFHLMAHIILRENARTIGFSFCNKIPIDFVSLSFIILIIEGKRKT